MPDWDKDSPQLQKNLKKAVETARNHARAREEPSLDQSRRWHTEIMRGLQVSPDARRSWVGHFRGETGQEMVRVHVGGHEGTAPSRVADELSSFEKGLKAAVNHLDEKIPPGTLPDTESLDMILLLMSCSSFTIWRISLLKSTGYSVLPQNTKSNKINWLARNW